MTETVSVTYIDSKGTPRTVKGQIGQTLMEVAVANGVPEIEAACGGACACATCHVYVADAWIEQAGKAERMEEDMLDFAFDVHPTSRLSCQIKLTPTLDGLTVTTPAHQA
jgi:ferredoxin, 2Fe-2S